jgi:hypothetical protein
MNSRNIPKFFAAVIPVLLFAQLPVTAQSVKFVKVVSKTGRPHH